MSETWGSAPHRARLGRECPLERYATSVDGMRQPKRRLEPSCLAYRLNVPKEAPVLLSPSGFLARALESAHRQPSMLECSGASSVRDQSSPAPPPLTSPPRSSPSKLWAMGDESLRRGLRAPRWEGRR